MTDSAGSEADPKTQDGAEAEHAAAGQGDEGVQEAATSVDADPGGLGALGGLSDQVRSTAKWLIGGFAAVGVLLVPGLQLANLGTLSGGKLAWALASAFVGVAAVISAAWIITRVLAVSPPSYAQLVKREKRAAERENRAAEREKRVIETDPLLKVLKANRTLLQAEATTIEDLRHQYRQAIAECESARSVLNPRSARTVGGVAPPKPSAEELERAPKQLESAQARVGLLRPILDQLSAIAEFQDVRYRFLRSRIWVAGLTVIAAAALVSFALAVHTPSHAASDFHNARLAHLDLSGANLEEADFSGAQLTAVDLQGTNLDDANFSGAHLTKVDLEGALTSGVKADGAVLTMSTCVDGTLDGPTTTSAATPGPPATKRCFSPRPLKPPVADATTDVSRGRG